MCIRHCCQGPRSFECCKVSLDIEPGCAGYALIPGAGVFSNITAYAPTLRGFQDLARTGSLSRPAAAAAPTVTTMGFEDASGTGAEAGTRLESVSVPVYASVPTMIYEATATATVKAEMEAGTRKDESGSYFRQALKEVRKVYEKMVRLGEEVAEGGKDERVAAADLLDEIMGKVKVA